MFDRIPATHSYTTSPGQPPHGGRLDFEHIKTLCRNSRIGKQLPDALYVHISAIAHLDPDLQAYEQEARREIVTENFMHLNLVKFSKSTQRK